MAIRKITNWPYLSRSKKLKVFKGKGAGVPDRIKAKKK